MKSAAAFGAAGLAGLLTSGCGEDADPSTPPGGGVQSSTAAEPPPDPGETDTACRDPQVLSQHSREVRQALDYTPETPVPGERCDNCRYYVPPASKGACGGCEHFAGPVTADGWCAVWDAPAS